MSDNSQTLVAIGLSMRSAKAKVAPLRKHLVEAGIVNAKADCPTLSGDLGHAPGPNVKAALAPCKPAVLKAFLTTGPIGVQFINERRVFDTGGNGVELACSKCERKLIDPDEYMDAVGAWAEGDDDAAFACPRCGFKQPVTLWTGPFAFGLGCLGVEFSNWPILSAEFVASLAERLGTHTTLVRQHI